MNDGNYTRYYGYTDWLIKNSIDINCVELVQITELLTKDNLTKNDLEDWFSQNLDENTISKIIGGATGLVLGKKIGRLIAKALGVKDGVLYDILTSRIIAARIGIAMGKRR